MEQPEKIKIAREVLAYLTEHPGAQDTLEGIVEWWLLDQAIREWTKNVREALMELVAEGLVIERNGRDGRTHYRVNGRKLGAIRKLLDLTPKQV
jgi:predicted urease superfamily metal-dependent hydrolase